MDWPEAKKNADHVRQWGIEQLLAIWKRAKSKERDALRWGDEIEYLVVAFEEDRRKVKLSLRQADILAALADDEALSRQGGCVPDLQAVKSSGNAIPVFHPEFGRFMLEATPGKPWGIGFKDLLDVEPNMKLRLVNITMRSSRRMLQLTCSKADHGQRPHGIERVSNNLDDFPSTGHQG